MLLGASLGLPIPEELPIVLGGVLSHQGIFRWWLALPVTFLGVLSGDAVLFWVGHHWGEHVLGWGVVRRVLSRDLEERLKRAYRENGVKIVFTARHVIGLRAAAMLTAGIARVPFWTFLAVDAGAALVGVPLGFGLAYLFADRVESVLADVHRIERWLGLLTVLAVATWLGVRASRRGRRS